MQYVWDGKGVKALDEFTLRDGGDSPGGVDPRLEGGLVVPRF